MNTSVMFSSETDMWATPQEFFAELDQEFNFTLDPCASPENAKCAKYFTVEDDGLRQDWAGHTVFCNPPYGRQIGKWVKKYEESKAGTTVVMLIPRQDRYVILPRLRLQQGAGNPVYQGRLKFGNTKFSTFSKHGCYI